MALARDQGPFQVVIGPITSGCALHRSHVVVTSHEACGCGTEALTQSKRCMPSSLILLAYFSLHILFSDKV